MYDFQKKKEKPLGGDVVELSVSMDGETMLLVVEGDDQYRIQVCCAGEKPGDQDEDEDEDGEEDGEEECNPGTGWVDVDGRVSLVVDPRQEWFAMLQDVWQSYKECF